MLSCWISGIALFKCLTLRFISLPFSSSFVLFGTVKIASIEGSKENLTFTSRPTILSESRVFPCGLPLAILFVPTIKKLFFFLILITCGETKIWGIAAPEKLKTPSDKWAQYRVIKWRGCHQLLGERSFWVFGLHQLVGPKKTFKSKYPSSLLWGSPVPRRRLLYVSVRSFYVVDVECCN